MRNYSRPILYFSFAGLCTLLNLGTQRLVNSLPPVAALAGSLTVYIGILAGTAIGVVTKFLLDKFIVFRYRGRSAAANLWKLFLYCLFGILTTVVFWGLELLFYYAWSADAAKYLGGFFGLVAGYLIKYYLDKTFVFNSDVR